MACTTNEIGIMDFAHAQTAGTHLFQCVVQGEPLPSIRWVKDGEAIQDDPRFLFDLSEDGVVSMVIRDVTTSDSGHYQCIAENSEGFAVSSSHLVVKGLKDGKPESPCVSMQLMDVDNSSIPELALSSTSPVSQPMPSAPYGDKGSSIPELALSSTTPVSQTMPSAPYEEENVRSMNMTQTTQNDSVYLNNLESETTQEDRRSSSVDGIFVQSRLAYGNDEPKDTLPLSLSKEDTAMNKEDCEQQSSSVLETNTTWVDYLESRAENQPEGRRHGEQVDSSAAVNTENRETVPRSETQLNNFQSDTDEAYFESQNQLPTLRLTTVRHDDSFCQTRRERLLGETQETPNSQTNYSEVECIRKERKEKSDANHQSSVATRHEDQDQGILETSASNNNQTIRTITGPVRKTHDCGTKSTSNQAQDQEHQPIPIEREYSNPLPAEQALSIPVAQISRQLTSLGLSTIEILESGEGEEVTGNTSYTISGTELAGQTTQDDGVFSITDVVRAALEDGTLQLSFTATMQIPQFVQPPSDVTVSTSDTIVLTCVVRGYPELNVTWTKEEDRSELKAGDRVTQSRQGDVHRLEIRSADPSDSGQYICTASNSEGHVIATVTVTVEGFGSSVDDLSSSTNVSLSDQAPSERLSKHRSAETEQICSGDSSHKDSETADVDENGEQADEDQGAVGGQLVQGVGHSVLGPQEDSRTLRYAKLVGMAAAFSLAALGVNKVFDMLHK
ncbi:myosin light chain kinase, smooth muscle [Elysia marginata]|uniref:Myosin light chain kinase, smooth muscle n=1 Tax=Elysia marginata TaxID=1093978 RepID=A0AAV4FSX2_9GAST|nr:myosin light chain kinase, smooth muscle [Elysia marginata]